jgi:hypothetical protein
LRNNQAMEQVKVNAIIPEADREVIHGMAREYETTVQRMVAILIGYGIRDMTAKQIRQAVKLAAQKSPTRKYQRTKPI